MAELAVAPPVRTNLTTRAEATPAPRGVMPNLFRDVLWQTLGQVGGSLIGLAMTMALVRTLGRDDFGAFGLVQSAAKWCAFTFSLGAGTNLLVQAGQCRNGDKSRVVGSCLIYLLITVSVTWMLIRIDPPGPGSQVMSQLSPGVGLLVVLFTATTAFFAMASRMLQGADRFRLLNLTSLTWSGLLAAGAVLGASLTGDYVAALTGGAIGVSVVALAIALMGIKSWGIALPSWRSFVRMGGSVGLRAYITTIAEIGAETFGIFYLSYRHDLAGVAAVWGCQRIAMLISKPASVGHAVLKGKSAGQESDEAQAKKALQLARLSFLFGILLCCPLLLFARQVTLVTLGEGFGDAVTVMVLFLLSQALRGHATPAAGLLVGQGCPMSYLILKTAVLVFTVAGVVILAPAMGAVGVALVQCLMSLLMAVVISALLAKQAKSVKSVFTGDDLLLLARLVRFKNHPLQRGRA